MDIQGVRPTGNGPEPKTSQLVPWILFLIFLAVLNETVFNVSTPKVAEQYGLGPASVSWMMTIFMVIFGIGSVIYGKLADMFSLRSLISVGITLYALGSLIGFAFQAFYPLVVLGRAVQGAGASAIPALIFVVVARHFPHTSRGRIFGLITSVVSLSIGLGPVIGGFVSGSLHWSLLFLIPLLALIAIPFIWRALPAEKSSGGQLDLPGAILVAALVGSLVIFMNRGDWPWLLATSAVAVLAVWRFRTAREPFIDLTLFTNRLFRNGVVVGFTLFSIVIGILFLVPLLLHGVHGLGTAAIGLVLFPGAISSVVFGPLGGKLADRKGNSLVVSLGLSLIFVSLISMAILMPLGPWVIGAALFLTYIGFSFFQTALINSISQVLPVEQTGVGMGVFNLISIVSGALGTAVVGRILESGALDFSLVPRIGEAGGAVYSNLLVVFAAVVVLGAWWYLRSFRPSAAAKVEQRADEGTTDQACVDCDA